MATSLVLLLLALSAFSAFADVNIDCGSSEIYTDDDSLPWVGDSDLMTLGEAFTVDSNYTAASPVMSTLRMFSSRNKNCYGIKVTKGEQVLVRAFFYYGNYDQKASPPIFVLQFDGNHWATVVTSMDRIIYHEAVYVVKGDYISVCLAQLFHDQLPFISALQVRSLSATMYSHVTSDYALFLRRRVAFGTNETIRYSADEYDRIWLPATVGNVLLKVTSDALSINSTAEDNPPPEVLQNAITSTNVSFYITLSTSLPIDEGPAYINLYFSEVSQLTSSEKRSLEVYLDDNLISDPIIPPYGGVIEATFTNITGSANSTLAIMPSAGSTLPPLINAMEVFSVSDVLTAGTDSNDVGGLDVLQTQFEKLQEWIGDPCLPAPFVWDWVNCSSDATPRVTALYLRSFGLSGYLPDFSAMDALEIIDLRNNSFEGPIPEFLGTLPNLKELNLADNNFQKPIPSSLSKNNQLKLDLSGNPSLCDSGNSCKATGSSTDTKTDTNTDTNPGSPPSGKRNKKKKKNKLPIILGSSIPSVFVFLAAVVGVLAILHHKRKAAIVAAVSAGQIGGAKMPDGTPQRTGVQTQMGNMGQTV